MMAAKILLVDDDPDIRELMRLYIAAEGLEVIEAGNGKEAIELLNKGAVNLVVLDIMMPYMDGWELCREIRRRYPDLPLLMVTAKGESADKVKGFHLGTDDYVVKPFDPVELTMRVKALLKRYRIASSQKIQIHDIVIDRSTYEVYMQKETILLPPKEFELLFTLASYPSQIFTRAQLIELIWGIDYEGDERTIDVHIKRLRERFESAADRFVIATIRGLGYRLEVSS
ncbi:response regulator transcription factor [Paenibacillus ginsengihumi]|uniref:response regulator transcription factor n=1 Tax=Paenibacillus ginsengihumi TaxID=431596 RepID=UPI0003A99549|nr:response regulator transcription factor [Paenibacillus ginsengihumi]